MKDLAQNKIKGLNYKQLLSLYGQDRFYMHKRFKGNLKALRNHYLTYEYKIDENMFAKVKPLS